MSRLVVWVAPKFHYKSATVGAREKTSAIAWTRIGKGVVRLALGQSSVLKLYCKSAKMGGRSEAHVVVWIRIGKGVVRL